jgi:hypothetical protein
MARTTNSAGRELAAISSILKALNGLDGESIQRVLDYVFGRLNITAPRHVKGVGSLTQHPVDALLAELLEVN